MSKFTLGTEGGKTSKHEVWIENGKVMTTDREGAVCLWRDGHSLGMDPKKSKVFIRQVENAAKEDPEAAKKLYEEGRRIR